MRPGAPAEPKPEWIGSSKKDLKALPQQVVHVFGYALYLAQIGEKHEQAKVLSGFGSAGVLEVVEDWRGDTYRAVYTVRYAVRVFVLQVFQKKSKSGIATPKADLDLIKSRLKVAARRAEELQMRKRKVNEKQEIHEGSGNVYRDLGFRDAEEMLVKAQLVHKISEIIRSRGLTQVEAAKILGLTQPKLSGILRGKFRGVSERKLIDCLTSLGRDVEIVVKDAPRRGASGKLTVVFA